MAGQQSAGFDLVMEFSEKPLRDIFGVAFDTSNLLCTIIDATLNQIPGVSIPCEGFLVTVSFDRPADVSLTPAQTNAVDIQLSQTVGISWRIRIVAGVDVDRSASQLDVAILDFKNRLYHLEAHLGALPLDVSTLRTYLQNTQKSIPLLPMIVDRAATNDSHIKQMDVKVIDQIGGGENALCYCFTFGAGVPGNLDGLSQSVIGAGDTGTLMVGFGFILRLMTPVIDASLGIPADAFANGHLTRAVTIDAHEDVSLTSLDFALVNGAIQVAARVAKSGFCYTASATVGGQFSLAVQNGELQVAAQLNDPQLDLDVPWYCWLGAAFLGALLGGIIGGIVVPLVLYLVTSTIEDTVNRIADLIVTALNQVAPHLDLPAVGFNLIFQNAFIDDVGVGFRVKVKDTAPVRCEGTVRLGRDQALDLDSGRVADGQFDGADLQWVGVKEQRKLVGLCSVRIAGADTILFDEIPRFRLYSLDYVQGRALAVQELGVLEDLNLVFVDLELFLPSLEVYAVRTNERRYALIQVVDVQDDAVRVRYRTYGTHDPSVQIRGGFSCNPVLAKPPIVPAAEVPRGVAFVPTEVPAVDVSSILARLPGLVRRAAAPAAKAAPASVVQSTLVPRLQQLSEVERANGISLVLHVSGRDGSATVSAQEAHALLANGPLALSASIGRWMGTVQVATLPVGRFDAYVEGIGTPRAVLWWIDDVLLDPQRATMKIDGVTYAYQQSATRLVLEPKVKSALTFELRVAVDDANGKRFTSSICVKFTPTCTHSVRAVPQWTRFRGLVTIPRSTL